MARESLNLNALWFYQTDAETNHFFLPKNCKGLEQFFSRESPSPRQDIFISNVSNPHIWKKKKIRRQQNETKLTADVLTEDQNTQKIKTERLF